MPPYAQIAVLPVVRIGRPPNKTVGAAGIQGPGTIGIHGVGAPTAVQAANAGLSGLLQNKKVTIFTNGLLSIIDAAGNTPITTLADGITISGTGIVPKLHCNIDPIVAHGFAIIDYTYESRLTLAAFPI